MAVISQLLRKIKSLGDKAGEKIERLVNHHEMGREESLESLNTTMRGMNGDCLPQMHELLIVLSNESILLHAHIISTTNKTMAHTQHAGVEPTNDAGDQKQIRKIMSNDCREGKACCNSEARCSSLPD